MKRMLVGMMALLLVTAGVWAQGQGHGNMMSDNAGPRARACGYGYGMDGMGMGSTMSGMQGMNQMNCAHCMAMMNNMRGMGQMGDGPGMGMMGDNFMMGTNSALMAMYHADVLNLTDDQVEELENLYVENQNELIDARANLAKTQLRMKQLTLRGDVSEDDMTAAIDEITQAYADVLKTGVRNRQTVLSVLTPEQQEQFREMRETQLSAVDPLPNMHMNGDQYHSNGQDRDQRKR